MKTFTFVGILLFALAVFAAEAPRTSIEACGSLLPTGVTVDFELRGTIDTTGVRPVFRGNLNLSDDSDRAEPRAEELIQPFLSCIEPLIKGS